MTVKPLESTPITGRVAVDSLTGEVGRWEGVDVRDHRFGGTAFHLGRRQLGHLHEGGGSSGFADIPVTRTRRDELIAAGSAHPHHVLPDSGWVTVPIHSVSDLATVVEILRENYDRAASRPGRTTR
jgi:Luciferase